MSELKPCPFCGSTDIDPEFWGTLTTKGPGCNQCSGTADSVEAWNRRSPALPLRELVDKAANDAVDRINADETLCPGWFPRGKDIAVSHVRAAIESALSAGGVPSERAEFRLYCTDGDDEYVAAEASGIRNDAWAEICRYAAQYAQDGPVRIEEIIRIPVAAPKPE